LKAFIERFYCIAEEDPNPPLGRYEKYPVKDAALLMISADNFFWTYEQAASYYKFAIINYIGFMTKECFWLVGAEIPTENHRSIKQII